MPTPWLFSWRMMRNKSSISALFNAAVGSVIPINGPISVAFNQAIDSTTLRAQFLDVLDEYHVKATFCLIGYYASKNIDRAAEIAGT